MDIRIAACRALDNGARLHDTIPSVINESNSASCSGMPGVSDTYATSLWSLDYLMQTAESGVGRVQFHTNTAAICGDFKPRASAMAGRVRSGCG